MLIDICGMAASPCLLRRYSAIEGFLTLLLVLGEAKRSFSLCRSFGGAQENFCAITSDRRRAASGYIPSPAPAGPQLPPRPSSVRRAGARVARGAATVPPRG